MDKLQKYRQEIAAMGLLAEAVSPEPEGPPLSEEQQAQAIREHYFENLKQLVKNDRASRSELERLAKELFQKRRGPVPRLEAKQAFMLVEIKRMQGLSYGEACEQVATAFGYELDSIKTMHHTGRLQLRNQEAKSP